MQPKLHTKSTTPFMDHFTTVNQQLSIATCKARGLIVIFSKHNSPDRQTDSWANYCWSAHTHMHTCRNKANDSKHACLQPKEQTDQLLDCHRRHHHQQTVNRCWTVTIQQSASVFLPAHAMSSDINLTALGTSDLPVGYREHRCSIVVGGIA